MNIFGRFRARKTEVAEPKAPAPVPVPAPAPTPALTGQRFALDRARMFSLDQTRRLEVLFRTPRAARDQQWAEAFYDAAWYASIALGDPIHFSGPDGFSYYRLNMPPEHTPFDSQSLGNLARDCCERYAGAAIFASADAAEPEFVFTMGLLDSMLRYDTPHGDPIDRSESAQSSKHDAFKVEAGTARHTIFTVTKTHEILTASPSAEFLPACTARGLSRYMSHIWGIENPAVCLLVDAAMRPSRSLVIGRKRSTFASDEDIAREMTRLLWFLPEYRSIIAMPEDWTFASLYPLADLTG